MNKLFLSLSVIIALSINCMAQQEDARTFTNAEGLTFEDRVMKYDFEKQVVLLEKKGNVPFDSFEQDDQNYILHWNQINGFSSSMRFKLEVQKSNWARMKYEQNVTPFYMDAIQIPGKRNPIHNIIMLEDYEEYNAIYMEAEGFELKMRNQNFFPIENLVIESKIFYEQEEYALSDSVFLSGENEFSDTVVTNKVRFLSESLPQIIQHEEVTLHSECAIIMDHQIERTSIVSSSGNEDDEGDDSDDGTDSIDGFGDWDDHSRRKKGKVTGVWFRIGIKGLDGELVWREITSPTSLADKYSWDPLPIEPVEE